MIFRGTSFFLNFMLALIGTAVVMQVVDFLPGLQGSFAVLLALPLLISAMIEGQWFARVKQMRPTSRQCWGAALWMGGIVTCFTLSCFALMAIFIPAQILSLMGGENTATGLVLLAIVATSFPLLRAGYAIGLASELRGQQIGIH